MARYKRQILLFLGSLWYGLGGYAQLVFPTPGHVEPGRGCWVLRAKTVSVCAPDTAAFYVSLFRAEVLKQAPVVWRNRRTRADICWQPDASLPPEGYRISITPKRVTVAAADDRGFLYAVQTLRQWAADDDGAVRLACAEITDAPRSAWRCFMLDSGRQFQEVATIKKYIDMASLLKMNYFHWHLTEGLGWRLDIRSYPRLARVGGFVGKGAGQQGFYTQEEIRHIVRYAGQRGVTVVPEIDMPGHAEAALSAYPALGCFGGPVEVPEQGFTEQIFCAGKDETLRFLQTVLDEVCELFPSAYIHLGGDEAPKGNWDKCPDCRARRQREGLADSHDLQRWFAVQMADYLKRKGRKAVFWDDVVAREGRPLPDNAVIQWWNYRGGGEQGLRNALKQGLPVICSPNYYTYLNFPTTPWRGYGKERTFDLRDVYERNPADKALAGKDSLVRGMTAALWTDYGVEEAMIDRRLFPRILGLAQQMWYQGPPVAFEDFYDGVMRRQAWFERLGYGFGPALREETPRDYNWD